jgi:hypothetical protein
MNDWRLAWNHGKVAVQPLGGMVDVQFLLPSGKTVSPMYRAPWIGEPIAADVPAMIQRLRGDWFCVPFGAGHSVPGLTDRWKDAGEPEAGGLVHGYGSHHEWRLVSSDEWGMVLRIDYPEASPIARLERTIRPRQQASAIDFELKVEAKAPVSLPIGLHPTFRLSPLPRTTRIDPGSFRFGLTYPGDFEPGAFFPEPDAEFDSLERVPMQRGGTADFSRLPLEGDSETLVQLCDTDGRFNLANAAEKYQVWLEWDSNKLPSCVLWISNRCRKRAPWNGRNVALGIEPVCSAFEMGNAVSSRRNPISEKGVKTAVAFKKAETWKVEYSIGAEEL